MHASRDCQLSGVSHRANFNQRFYSHWVEMYFGYGNQDYLTIRSLNPSILSKCKLSMDKYTYEDSNFIGENHPDIPSSNESLFYNRRFLMLHIAISQICVNWIFFLFFYTSWQSVPTLLSPPLKLSENRLLYFWHELGRSCKIENKY